MRKLIILAVGLCAGSTFGQPKFTKVTPAPINFYYTTTPPIINNNSAPTSWLDVLKAIAPAIIGIVSAATIAYFTYKGALRQIDKRAGIEDKQRLKQQKSDHHKARSDMIAALIGTVNEFQMVSMLFMGTARRHKSRTDLSLEQATVLNKDIDRYSDEIIKVSSRLRERVELCGKVPKVFDPEQRHLSEYVGQWLQIVWDTMFDPELDPSVIRHETYLLTGDLRIIRDYHEVCKTSALNDTEPNVPAVELYILTSKAIISVFKESEINRANAIKTRKTTIFPLLTPDTDEQ